MVEVAAIVDAAVRSVDDVIDADKLECTGVIGDANGLFGKWTDKLSKKREAPFGLFDSFGAGVELGPGVDGSDGGG